MADGFSELKLEQLKSPDGINQLNRMLRTIYDNISGDTDSVRVFSGYGSPEGVVTAGIGSMYMRVDGGANTATYRKETGDGNTGWVADSNVTLPISVANGGTGADNSAVVQGVIPYFSATGVISGLATGISGQYLKTNGAGANPSWATFTTPALTLVSTTTPSAASSSGNISITNTKRYMVLCSGFVGSNQSSIKIRFNADTTATAYDYVGRGFDTSAAANNVNSASADGIVVSGDIYQNWYEMVFYIMPQNGTGQISVHGKISGDTSFHDFFGFWSNAAAATTFVLSPTVGTFSGNIYLYEIT